MTGFWRQATAILSKDLRAELRTGEVLLITIPFGAVALMLTPMAVGVDAPLLRSIGTGIYWVVVMLFGVLVAMRASGVDAKPQRDLLALLAVDPAATFAGRTMATGVLLLCFEVVLGPVAIALYDIQVEGWPWVIALVPLVATGLALLGTLAGMLAANQSSTALVPLLVAPMAVPMLLAASQVMDGLRVDATIVGWLLLLIAMDLLLAVAGVVSARPLQETSG